MTDVTVPIVTTPTVPAKVVDDLYNAVVEISSSQEITTGTIVAVVLSLMQLVEKLPNMTGIQKKAAVIRALERFVQDKVQDAKTEQDLILLIQTTVPGLIDTLVSIDRNELQIKVKSCFKKTFSCCSAR